MMDMSTTPHTTAADLLRYAADDQADLVAEMLSETGRGHLLARIRKATALGFLVVTPEGIYRLTEAGAAYVKAHPAAQHAA